MKKKFLIALCLIIKAGFCLAKDRGENNIGKQDLPIQEKSVVLKKAPAPELTKSVDIDNNEYEKPASMFEAHIVEEPAKAPVKKPPAADPLLADFCSSNRQELIKAAVSKHLNTPCQDITIEDLKRVRSIVIENTNMTSLAKEDLKGMDQILFISFQNNRLKEIHPEAFENLNQLSYLDLSYNLLEDSSFDSSTFKSLVNLNTLNLSRNLIKTPHPEWFLHLSRLNHLNLSYNLLDQIPQNLFLSLNNLITLNLSYNKLKNWPERAVNSLTELIELDLSFNQMSRMNAQSFNSLSQLVRLDLSHNRLTSIENGAFSFLRNLIFLDLSNNNLTSMDWSVFSAMTRLETLNYSTNPLENVLIDPQRDVYTTGWDKDWYECWAIDCWNTYAFIEVNNQKYKWMQCQGSSNGDDSHCARTAKVWLENLEQGYSLILQLKRGGERIKSVYRAKTRP